MNENKNETVKIKWNKLPMLAKTVELIIKILTSINKNEHETVKIIWK